jgi:hypothetical protein
MIIVFMTSSLVSFSDVVCRDHIRYYKWRAQHCGVSFNQWHYMRHCKRPLCLMMQFTHAGCLSSFWSPCAQGVLRGFDQATNLILDESHERVYSTKVSLCWVLNLRGDALYFVELYLDSSFRLECEVCDLKMWTLKEQCSLLLRVYDI